MPKVLLQFRADANITNLGGTAPLVLAYLVLRLCFWWSQYTIAWHVQAHCLFKHTLLAAAARVKCMFVSVLKGVLPIELAQQSGRQQVVDALKPATRGFDQ